MALPTSLLATDFSRCSKAKPGRDPAEYRKNKQKLQHIFLAVIVVYRHGNGVLDMFYLLGIGYLVERCQCNDAHRNRGSTGRAGKASAGQDILSCFWYRY